MKTELQIKQYLGVLRTKRSTFNVYIGGRPGWVVLRPLIPGLEDSGIEGGLEFPYRRSDFKRGVLPRG